MAARMYGLNQTEADKAVVREQLGRSVSGCGRKMLSAECIRLSS
jgi:hypothetical protein